MRLRQVQRPAEQANWKEHFYSGELDVVNGETETDNQEWVNQLLGRGYIVVDEHTPDLKDMNVYGNVYADKPVEPVGTQVVDANTDVDAIVDESRKNETETVPVEESRADADEGTTAVNVVEEPVYQESLPVDEDASENDPVDEDDNNDVANVGKDDSFLEDMMQAVLTGPRPRLLRKEN